MNPEPSSLNAPIRKRSILIAGHSTSVSLEEPFWDALKEIALRREKTISTLIADIDQHRGKIGLSSAIRLYILNVLQSTSCEKPLD